MYRQLIESARNVSLCVVDPRLRPSRQLLRYIATDTGYESKYARQLRQRAEENGLSVDALKAKIRNEQAEDAQRKRELKTAKAAETATNASHSNTTTSISSEGRAQAAPLSSNIRKDSSPVKPLASILNLSKLVETPHTSEQIGVLWTAYHMSRSNGTGRGYVCAAVPVELYQQMAHIAERFPTFIVPLPRVNTSRDSGVDEEEETAYEFYFMQWDFHGIPPVPTATEDIFAPSRSPSLSEHNPKMSTILFTPLQEYKMRGAFATPYLVLTHYTDFARSHGVILLRGEITPTSASGGGSIGRYMLSQEDAQLLSMAVQKFYLWDGEGQASEGQRLLKCFHETPGEFKWEELLKHSK